MKYFGKVFLTRENESEKTVLYVIEEGLYPDAVVVCNMDDAKRKSLGGSEYIGKIDIFHPYAFAGTYESVESRLISKAYEFLKENDCLWEDKRGLHFLTDKSLNLPDCK